MSTITPAIAAGALGWSPNGADAVRVAPPVSAARIAERARAEAPRTRLRLTRRGRAVVAALAAAPLAAVALAVALNGGAAAAGGEGEPVVFDHVVVADGETLWGIAETVAPAADPREVVHGFMELNGLESAVVQAGDELAVPLEYTR
jgi:hypothetical protein